LSPPFIHFNGLDVQAGDDGFPYYVVITIAEENKLAIKLRALCTIILLVFALSNARAQNTLSEEADRAVEGQLAAQKIPGLALAVCRNAQLIKASGYGLANVELDAKVTPETIFQTGSVGKQFTAMAVMMLVEEREDRARRQDQQIYR
jgi:hypothetical protein